MEGWRVRSLVLRLAEFGNLIKLADTGSLIDVIEHHTGDDQDGHAEAAAPDRGIRRVAQFRIVDVVRVVAADILLRDEARRAQRGRMAGVGGGKKLSDQRQRARVAAPSLAATGGIASNDQRLAALAEIARIVGLFGDAPAAGQANSVRMQQPAKALSVRPPAQVGRGIDGPLSGLAKYVGLTVPQYATQYAPQRNLVRGQRRIALRARQRLIRICEQRLSQDREA